MAPAYRLAAICVALLWLGGYAAEFVTGVRFMHPFAGTPPAFFPTVIGFCVLGLVVRKSVSEQLGDRALWFAVWTVGTIVLFEVFGQWKNAIPALDGFHWDPQLARLDRRLLGDDAWHVLQPVLGHPPVTRALDLLYKLWTPMLVLMLGWLSWFGGTALRRRFALAFVLTWIVLGVGFAHLISSAGPCFYGAVTGDTARFAPLLSYLDSVQAAHGLMARSDQAWLWWLYSLGHTTSYTGISSMPSLHVAIPVLFALAVRPANPMLGLASWLYTALIWLGSIHLGWHYAIDGGVSAVIVTGIWWVAGQVNGAETRAVLRSLRAASPQPTPEFDLAA